MDKLPDDYGFNGYDVARSSYLVQRTTNEWQSKVNIDSYFSWVPQTSGSDIPAWQMMRWNLPVCDLAEYGVEEECGSGLLWDVVWLDLPVFEQAELLIYLFSACTPLSKRFVGGEMDGQRIMISSVVSPVVPYLTKKKELLIPSLSHLLKPSNCLWAKSAILS